MKAFLILVLIGAAAYFGYKHFKSEEGAAPDVIENPIYADYRLNMHVAGRDIEFALFGKMASQADCDVRGAKTWLKVIEGCKECVQESLTCKPTLPPRYQRLFDNVPIHSAYMSFNRGSKYERDGRMVIFGLTADEGDMVCQKVLSRFQPNYAGKVECVSARRD